MSSRKTRPVLYELVGRSRRRREPAWTPRTAPAATEAPTEETSPRVDIAGEPRAFTRPRSVRLANGRLYAELGWPGMTVVATVIVVLLLVAFDAGRRYGGSDQPSAAPTSAVDPPDDGVVVGPDATDASPSPSGWGPVVQPEVTSTPKRENRRETPRSPATPPAERPTTFEAKPGCHYVVVQHFRTSQEQAAVGAGNYLITNGIDCFIMRDKDLQLIASEPFQFQHSDAAVRSAEQRRADNLRERIRTLGKEYAREHGYAFEQCYTRVLKKK